MLNQPCSTLHGVGPSIAVKLAQCGIHTLSDLVFHLPFRYQDRTRITPIQDIRPMDWCVIEGHVCQMSVSKGPRKRLDGLIEDKTGFIQLRFFHFHPQQLAQFQNQPVIRAFGEVREFAGKLTMIHPEYQVVSVESVCPVEETLTPIYSSTQGLSQKRLRQIIALALEVCAEPLRALEWMPIDELKKNNTCSIYDAVSQLHYPSPETSITALEQGAHPALKRLIMDELIAHQLSMQLARKARATFVADSLPAAPARINHFLSTLHFSLTGAQTRVYEDICQDLHKKTPMLRLIQGDVGSGKTVVAALAALQAIEHGFQVAMMAPTDLLSEQHTKNMQRWLEPLGIHVQRLSGQMKAKQRRESMAAIADGSAQLIVGTHALFQNDVQFHRLGLVIIDEQHRFGVEQRWLLQQKGQNEQSLPHQLLMTATPIPRTLAMSHFAHMDLSIIDELPPGRSPVITAVLSQAKRDEIILRLQHALENGRQAYWVCTLIEESESLECIAATDQALILQEQLPSMRVGLVHGRMKGAEKEAVMAAFIQGDIQLLVATTVIEVGVDVPNASVMIIDNAERLGLSQLHQLRGRVGRGSTQSHCLLLYQAPLSRVGAERLRIMRDTQDGFVIADHDLALRGAGEILGTRQTGYKNFKIANLARDKALLSRCRIHAQNILQHDPPLADLIATRWLGNYHSYLHT